MVSLIITEYYRLVNSLPDIQIAHLTQKLSSKSVFNMFTFYQKNTLERRLFSETKNRTTSLNLKAFDCHDISSPQ